MKTLSKTYSIAKKEVSNEIPKTVMVAVSNGCSSIVGGGGSISRSEPESASWS
jgi:hypothetical protein